MHQEISRALLMFARTRYQSWSSTLTESPLSRIHNARVPCRVPKR